MTAISWLPGAREGCSLDKDEVWYALDEIRAGCDVRELNGGWLALIKSETTPGSNWMSFAVLAFAQSEVGGEDTLVYLVFHGEGPGGPDSLRECRHTYWGEDGYIFYPNGALITSAFASLAEFFDDIVAE